MCPRFDTSDVPRCGRELKAEQNNEASFPLTSNNALVELDSRIKVSRVS
jgi:hypothetical protein